MEEKPGGIGRGSENRLAKKFSFLTAFGGSGERQNQE
jgi:hypothetical protein